MFVRASENNIDDIAKCINYEIFFKPYMRFKKCCKMLFMYSFGVTTLNVIYYYLFATFQLIFTAVDIILVINVVVIISVKFCFIWTFYFVYYN